MKKLLLLLIGGSASLGLTSCDTGGGVNSTSNKMQPAKFQGCPTQSFWQNTNDLKNLKDANFIMRMGSGVDSTTNTAVSSQSCLMAMQSCDPISITNPQASIDFSKQSDLSTLEKSLGVDVSGKYGGDRFSVSAAASFANASKDNKYSTNIIYLYKYAGTATFKEGALGESNAALTPTARELISHGDKTEFEEMCGDKFVSQMDAGATLAVRLTLSFNSHSDQQKLEAELKGEYGMASIAAALKMASNKASVYSNLTLSALQQGGDPQKLNAIFGKRDESSGNYPLLDCGDSTKSSNACNEMINSVIDYAQTIDKQVSKTDGTLDLQKLYYSNPVAQTWKSIQVYPYLLHPSPELLKAMEQMTANYDSTLADYTFSKHYTEGLRSKLSSTASVSLNIVTDRLGKRLVDVYNSPVYHLMSCYKGYVSNDCLDIKSNIEQALTQDKYKIDKRSNLIFNYLKDSAYNVDLYGLINKTTTPTPSDYGLIKGCILAPVSDPSDNDYAINCDGKWLNTKQVLEIELDDDNNNLIISGMSYDYFHPESAAFARNMVYYDKDNTSPVLYISADPKLPDVYTSRVLNVYGQPIGSSQSVKPSPANLITNKGMMKIIMLDDNPA